MPALLVAGDHAAGGQEAFADGAAALLGLAQAAAELVASSRDARPMMPAVRLVVRVRRSVILFDQQFLGHSRDPLPFQT